nr:hypothetical protein [Serratia odorifera]
MTEPDDGEINLHLKARLGLEARDSSVTGCFMGCRKAVSML